MLRKNDALIVVDVQNDFLPGGALAVPGGNEVIAPLSRCIVAFEQRGRPIFATRDWHPPDHCSFQSQGGRWPQHCVAGSHGAQFAAGLHLPASARIISKATDRQADAYSGFQGTDLGAQLSALGCMRVFVGGLATDYCVRATALDARSAGLEVIVLEDAVAAVDATEGDGQRAFQEMREHGVQLLSVGRSLTQIAAGHWEEFAHGADVGIRGFGASVAQAFEQAALAMSAQVCDLGRIQPREAVAFDCEAPDLELLLVEWLNQLIFEMSTRKMLFSRFAVEVEGNRLHAQAWGETIDRSRHEPAVEIKGATYTALRVGCEGAEWVAQTVLDV